MSWDASLGTTIDGTWCELPDCDWNYTHNCNKMMATVLEERGHVLESHFLIGHMGKSWMAVLNDLDGAQGTKLLDIIVKGMEDEPERFKAMNPDNGWGSYDGVLGILRDMREKSRLYPSAKWSIC